MCEQNVGEESSNMAEETILIFLEEKVLPAQIQIQIRHSQSPWICFCFLREA